MKNVFYSAIDDTVFIASMSGILNIVSGITIYTFLYYKNELVRKTVLVNSTKK